MSGGSWTGYEQLESAVAGQVDAACDAFEAAWRQGQRPDVAAHLGGLPGPVALVLARELILLDVAYRRRAGEDPGPDDYRARFPAVDPAWLRRAVEGPTVVTPGLLAPDPPGRLPADAVPGYELLGELGRGGMGVVYKARDVRLGRFVAIKFLTAAGARDPWRLGRFWREARAACALNHPAVCTLHDVGEHHGRPYLVLEWVDGQTLRSLVGPAPDLARLLPLVRQVAEALRVAHAAGIVHRDVKPENLMVRPDGYVKVLDFGLARLLPDPAGAGPAPPAADSDPGMLVGTVHYMAPEQARAAAVSSPADVFSLGVVLYELTTGRRPFGGATPFGTLHAIEAEAPLPPARLNPAVPPALDALILQMLAKAPHLRPTAAEVEEALRELAAGTSRPTPDPAAAVTARPTVGRAAERAALAAGFDAAAAGRALFLCVAGEPGIGKTTLVDALLHDLAAAGRLHGRARGQCSERLGGAEAYLPLLEALGDLLRGPAAEPAGRVLRLVAPTWHAQVAPPAADAEPAGPGRASSRERLTRELLAFFQEFTRLRPLVLVLEDVHWADRSTVDLLAHLGAHGAGLRLLVVLTYRPTELLLGKHPLHPVKLELQARGVCREVRLGLLGRGDVDAYLALAFPGHALPPDFADLIHARTEGNPLFMADLLRDLRERGVVADGGRGWGLARPLPDLPDELPESVRGLIQRKLDRLGAADRRLLAAASVQGPAFDSAAVAAALGDDPAAVEEQLQALDQVHGLVRLVREQELPDGALSLRYRFVHVLYQEALYRALPPSRRAGWSAAMAAALARHHGDQGGAAAAELACLYETARDFARAAAHYHRAAQNAARVFAHRAAAGLARRGLRLLQAVADPAARAAHELPLQMTLGLQLQVTEGFAAPQAKQAYTRAYELCRHDPAAPARFPALWGLWLYHKVRSELPTARRRADELSAMAAAAGDPALVLQAHQALAVTTLCLGEPAATRDHMERGVRLYDPERHRAQALEYGQDPGVACLAFGAVALWLLGRPDEAVRVSRAAVRRGYELAQPSTQVLALHFAAMVHQCRREPREALTYAELTQTVAAEQGFSFWHAGGAVLRGWALAETGIAAGVAVLRDGLRAWQATGSGTYQTYYLGLLADALTKGGQPAEGRAAVDEALALAERTAEGLYAAELHRLRGELLAADGAAAGAEASFRRALDVARQQQARGLELRAATSLARLLRAGGRAAEGRPLLAAVCDGFTEGADTPDLREARALVAERP